MNRIDAVAAELGLDVSLLRALQDVDTRYLSADEAGDLLPLRQAMWFRDGGLTDEETERAWVLVRAYRKRFREDVRTIGPTLTREEVEHLSLSDPNSFSEEEERRAMVAFELAMQRGGPNVHPRNIARVLYPVVKDVAPVWRCRGVRIGAPRARRSRSAPRARSPGRKPSDPEPPLADRRRP